MTVARFRDGSLAVAARVVTGDGKIGEGVTRIRSGHPEYEAWRSYCERHPEDVVERRDRLGPVPEPLAAGSVSGLAGTAGVFVFSALADEFDGVRTGDAVTVGVVIFIFWFAIGFIGELWSENRGRGATRAEVERPPADER